MCLLPFSKNYLDGAFHNKQCGVTDILVILTSYMLFNSQNWLSERLQTSYTLGGSQNWLSEPLQASYTLCGCENRLMPSTRFAVVKTDSRIFYTGLVHTLRQSKQTIQTSTAPDSSYIYSLPIDPLRQSKPIPRTSAGLLHVLYEPLQASYTLCCSQNLPSKPLQPL